MKRRLSILAALAALAAIPAGITPGPAVSVAKSCSSGYKHAVMPNGEHKCLRAGQFCSRKSSYQHVYANKGFYCKANKHLRKD
jgi:hypothetical protein